MTNDRHKGELNWKANDVTEGETRLVCQQNRVDVDVVLQFQLEVALLLETRISMLLCFFSFPVVCPSYIAQNKN